MSKFGKLKSFFSISWISVVALTLWACRESPESDEPLNPERESRNNDSGQSKEPTNRHQPERSANSSENGQSAIESGIIELLKTKTTALSSDEKKSAIRMMRSGNVDQCISVLSSMPVGPDYEILLEEFSERYASENLNASLDWLRNSPERAHMGPAYSRIGRRAASNPASTKTFIESIEDSGLKREFSQGYILGLAQNENFHALDEVLGSEQSVESIGLDNTTVFSTVVGALEDESALTQISSLIKRGIIPRNGTADLAVERLAKKNGEGLRDLLERNAGNGSSFEKVLARPTIEAWAKEEPIAASEWLVGQEGLLRDYGAAGLINGIARSDPVRAAQWASSISDPSLRSKGFRKISRLSNFDRGEVRNAIEGSELDAEEKNKYKNFFKE